MKSLHFKRKMMALFILLLSSNPLLSDTTTKCEMTIFGNKTKAPKSYNEDGQAKGILVDMLHYVGKEINCKFNIKLNPWKRAYKLASHGKGGIIGFSKTSQRIKLFDYSDVMYYDDMLLVVLKGNEFKFNTIDDLKGKKIGIVRGASFGEEFDNSIKTNLFKVVEDDSPVHRLVKLAKGYMDVALIGPGKSGVNAAIQKDPFLKKNKDKFVILPIPFNRDPNYLGLAKQMDKKDFLIKFNKALEKGHKSGTFEKIVQKY